MGIQFTQNINYIFHTTLAMRKVQLKVLLSIVIMTVILIYTMSTWIRSNFSNYIQENPVEKIETDEAGERPTFFSIERQNPSTTARPKIIFKPKENAVEKMDNEIPEKSQTPTTTPKPKPFTTAKPKITFKPKLKEPQRYFWIFTVPQPPESAAICESIFPRTAVKPPIGCQVSPSLAPPGIAFKCYAPIILSCSDSLEETRKKYYRHITRNHIECEGSRWLGTKGIGGWKACMAGPFKPNKDHCITYGFGVQYQWSFDEVVSSEYGCNDWAFDPSMGQEDHQHSERVWFYNTGLGGKDEEKNAEGWKMRTLYSIMKDLKHVNKTIDFLKFDIEFSEWAAIEAMLKDKALVNVKQIAFEIHTWRDTVKDYIYFWQILQGLEDIGFQKWYHWSLDYRCFSPVGIKRYCPQVNMYYINTNFIKAIS